jgi:hypothetical protein
MTADHNPTEWTRYRVRIEYRNGGVIDNRFKYPRTLAAARRAAERMMEERGRPTLQDKYLRIYHAAVIIETREQRHDWEGFPLRGPRAGLWQELERIEVTA